MNKQMRFIRKEERVGVGTVEIYDDGSNEPYEIITKPTKNYNICSGFLDRLLREKRKQNPAKYVA